MIDPSARNLTASVKKQITLDWHENFPGFAIYKPMWLLRRVGPILIGIILERDSSNDNYRPIFHIHNLTQQFATVSLTLSNQLKSKAGGGDWVTVRSHNANYLEAIHSFHKECFLPCEGPINLKQVLTAFKLKKKRNRFDELDANEFVDMALLCGWAGQPSKGQKLLKRARRMMDETVPWIDKEYGSVQAWSEHMQAIIQKPYTLQKVAEEEIIKHRLQNIPVSDFTY